MEEKRANPEQLLKNVEEEERRARRGHLRIFFGYAAGVGKTYAMLKAARQAGKNGFDTVIGYVEPHSRPETMALLDRQETLPPKRALHNGVTVREFDLDAALKRHPRLLIVDELAHTNVSGCRHEKRYQDVEELLAEGIDVYTTVNVQHIESLNDMIASITGIVVRERVPDKMFDDADQVKLVDIEPRELIERLNEGKIYQEDRAKQAMDNFFTIENLTALREIALRRCADRINHLTEMTRTRSGGEYYTDEHILVCLSASPTNQKIIRDAARMAMAFHGSFTALFIETSSFASMSAESKESLRANVHLAEQLGATTETSYGDDIALQISEFARLSGVSKIVVGRSSVNRRSVFSRPTLTEKLIAYAPNLDVYVIPDQHAAMRAKRKHTNGRADFQPLDILKSAGILAAATLIGYFFDLLGFSEANIITIYILCVLITAIVTNKRVYSLISSILGVLIFNFLFTVPRFSLNAYGSGYPATFLIMFIAAFITGTLAVKIKRQARQAASAAYRTKILLDTSQMLSQAKSKEEIAKLMSSQLIKLLDRDILFYFSDGPVLSGPLAFSRSESEIDSTYVTENEKAVAAWVYKNNKRAGATTATLSNSKCLYLAVRVRGKVYGVVGIAMNEDTLDSFEYSILLSILGESALAFENEQTAIEKEQAAILAKNEQLRANLLRSISHDLRTPLTAISGNAGLLVENSSNMTDEMKAQLYGSIYDDSLWLINLVENLLAVTRIENSSARLKLTAELLDEIIDEALRHVSRESAKHRVITRHSENFLLVKVDARLITQVIINIVDNAIKYTPEGSTIIIQSRGQNGEAIVTIADNGPGIPDESKPRIFDMFYTAEKTADSRRSMGIGLALCKSIINAHGGNISVSDALPAGAVFTFTLPLEEVTIHE